MSLISGVSSILGKGFESEKSAVQVKSSEGFGNKIYTFGQLFRWKSPKLNWISVGDVRLTKEVERKSLETEREADEM